MPSVEERADFIRHFRSLQAINIARYYCWRCAQLEQRTEGSTIAQLFPDVATVAALYRADIPLPLDLVHLAAGLGPEVVVHEEHAHGVEDHGVERQVDAADAVVPAITNIGEVAAIWLSMKYSSIEEICSATPSKY